MASRRLNIAAHFCRIAAGIVFAFSGFVKAVDPWGTALKVNEYLSIYGLDDLIPYSMIFSIWLCGAELMMGLMLTFKVRTRLISIFALASMTFFTILTFLSATWIPVEDCGCFGDALKLTPWQTFFKNVVLLVLSFIVWRGCRTQQRVGVRDVVILVVAIAIPLAINLYALRHLPIVDTMPYKLGTTIYHDVLKEREMEETSVQNVLIFRNITTGETVEFDAMDSTCWENENLEFVDAKTIESPVETTYGEFRLYNVHGEKLSARQKSAFQTRR